eukprot:1688972-Ditylum_brightwellii.AAC.1
MAKARKANQHMLGFMAQASQIMLFTQHVTEPPSKQKNKLHQPLGAWTTQSPYTARQYYYTQSTNHVYALKEG